MLVTLRYDYKKELPQGTKLLVNELPDVDQVTRDTMLNCISGHGEELRLRIAAFEEEAVIIRSLEEGVSMEEARDILLKERLEKSPANKGASYTPDKSRSFLMPFPTPA